MLEERNDGEGEGDRGTGLEQSPVDLGCEVKMRDRAGGLGHSALGDGNEGTKGTELSDRFRLVVTASPRAGYK